MPVEQRVVIAVEGIPFNTAGWTAATPFERLSDDRHEGAMGEHGKHHSESETEARRRFKRAKLKQRISDLQDDREACGAR
mgnify:CR=1 FL=1